MESYQQLSKASSTQSKRFQQIILSMNACCCYFFKTKLQNLRIGSRNILAGTFLPGNNVAFKNLEMTSIHLEKRL